LFSVRIKDFFLRLFFEWGAKIYSNKLASGSEAELRKDFLNFVQLKPNSQVLDVGCGPGWLAIEAARQVKAIFGIDRSKRIIQLARQNAKSAGILNVDFQIGDASSLPYPDNSFDTVIVTTVNYLLPNPERAFAEQPRVSKPGGIIATLDPDVSISPARMRTYAKVQKLNLKDTFKLLAWASAARIYYPFSEERLLGLYETAGLKNIVLEKRMDGMVWFAKGKKPAQRM